MRFAKDVAKALNVLETQICRLHSKGMEVEAIAKVMKMSLGEIQRILGVLPEPIVVEKLVEVEKIVDRIVEVEAVDNSPEKKLAEEAPLNGREDFAMKILMQVAADKNADSNARVRAATTILDETKGRREVEHLKQTVTQAAQLNEAIKSIKAARRNPYAHLDKKQTEINVTET